MAHTENHDSAYAKVFLALAVLTMISFTVSETFHWRIGTILLVIGMATVKALLVASIFMHLKFDWRKVYVIIVPSLILATILVFALIPDIARGRRDSAPPPLSSARAATQPSHSAAGH